MKTMKMFIKWLLIFVLFYIFVDIISFQYIRSSYHDLPYTIQNQQNKIEIKESKATYINGYIKGTITNTSSSTIKETYITLDVYSKYKNNLEKQYSMVSDLKPNETKEFNIKYKAQKADHALIDTMQTLPEEYTTKDRGHYELTFPALVSIMILLYYFG